MMNGFSRSDTETEIEGLSLLKHSKGFLIIVSIRKAVLMNSRNRRIFWRHYIRDLVCT